MTARMIRYDDSYALEIQKLVEQSDGAVEIVKDQNLEYDPYFYERKAHLDKVIQAVDDGSMKMYDFNESMDMLDEFLDKLEKNVCK